MFDIYEVHPDHTDRDILVKLLKGLHAMAIDISKLTVAVERNVKAVDALVAIHTDPVVQSAIDTAVANLDAESFKAEEAVKPPPTPEPPVAG